MKPLRIRLSLAVAALLVAARTRLWRRTSPGRHRLTPRHRARVVVPDAGLGVVYGEDGEPS